MPHVKLNESYLDRVTVPGLDKAFIINDPHLESILFNRNLMGLEFTQACEGASAAFLEHFRPEIEPLIADGIAELMLMSKGLYYWMHNAFARVFHQNLEINFAATRRAEVSSSAVRIEIPYSNFDSPAQNLILGDTIASGATICAALSLYLQH
jgi:hypothetical protein